MIRIRFDIQSRPCGTYCLTPRYALFSYITSTLLYNTCIMECASKIATKLKRQCNRDFKCSAVAHHRLPWEVGGNICSRARYLIKASNSCASEVRAESKRQCSINYKRFAGAHHPFTWDFAGNPHSLATFLVRLKTRGVPQTQY